MTKNRTYAGAAMGSSDRLRAVASLATEGYRVADIGTDHAYIPIYLVENNIAPSAIAADINPGPLRRARENVRAANLLDRIELRLSDGLNAFSPGEADTLILSGMGGSLIIKILSASPQVTYGFKECILQPQSEIAKVRAFLLKNNFSFVKEDMAYEDGKFYPVMKALPSKGGSREEKWDETKLLYGKLLLESKNPVLKLFLEKEIRLKQKIIDELTFFDGIRAKTRLGELETELDTAKKALRYYYF